MQVRDYRPTDFHTLCLIDRQCFDRGTAYPAEEMAAVVERRGAVILVAENARGRVVAFVVGHKLRGGVGHIVTLDVLPRYRGRGLGRELMLDCEKRLGAPHMRLEAAVGNRAAQKLYASLGYAVVGRRARYYPDGADAWLLEKTLHVRA